jgi:hypothetical protein
MHVQKRFEKITEKFPHYSSYTAFAETIRNTTLSESIIRRWFYTLVEADDYSKSEAQAILRYLLTLRKPSSKQIAL